MGSTKSTKSTKISYAHTHTHTQTDTHIHTPTLVYYSSALKCLDIYCLELNY